MSSENRSTVPTRPVIRGRLVHLRPIEPEDSATIHVLVPGVAQHLCESVGFLREGIARHAYYQDGRYQGDRPNAGMRIDAMAPEPL